MKGRKWEILTSLSMLLLAASIYTANSSIDALNNAFDAQIELNELMLREIVKNREQIKGE